jgi:hypothetical protein
MMAKQKAKTMTAYDREIIVRLARGELKLRQQAIEIFRTQLLAGALPRGTPEMRFMAEVDHPCPDHMLRSIYRKDLLDEDEERKT